MSHTPPAQRPRKRGQAQDSRRDAFLNDIGLSVLRFSNLDVLGNLDGVIALIVRHLEKQLGERKTKSPYPPFSKGEIGIFTRP